MLFQCIFWHLRKGVKNYFMLLGFLDLLFELCLPFLVLFLLLVSSSNRLPPAFLYMQTYISPLCRISSVHLHLIPCSTEIFGKLHVVLCRPPCLQIPAYAEHFCCLFVSCPEEVKPYLFSNTTQAISRLTTCALFYFLDNLFSWDRFHSIPPTGFAALKAFCLLVQKLSVHRLLSAAVTLWFRFVNHICSVSLVSTS